MMELSHNVLSALMDRNIVTDYASAYGEPGYHLNSEIGLVVLGDWWCRRDECKSMGRKIHGVEEHYPHLFAKMEKEGWELHFYDEWYVDSNADKAWRTEADSYQWQSSLLWTDGEILTPDDGIEAWLEEVVNNPRMALPKHVWTDAEIEAQGFEEYQCGFENGWHPGQTDDPVKIDALIREEAEPWEMDVLFKLSYVSQFDLGFCVFVRKSPEQVAYEAGYEAGKHSGSWVIDGNTTEETARTILKGWNDGDPATLDMAPNPLSGEWAEESIPELSDRWSIDLGNDSIADQFEQGFGIGYWEVVVSDCEGMCD